MSWLNAPGAVQRGRRSRLPAAGSAFGERAWWHVMGFEGGPPGSLADVERRFRRLAASAHPDRGGSAEQMHSLVRARAEARRQLSVVR